MLRPICYERVSVFDQVIAGEDSDGGKAFFNHILD
ncbi:MAG: hypothetical protein H6R25_791 [Proteobacteria bacterium]|nr:hypothetical protein [Pseudomonadota bacterium]